MDLLRIFFCLNAEKACLMVVIVVSLALNLIKDFGSLSIAFYRSKENAMKKFFTVGMALAALLFAPALNAQNNGSCDCCDSTEGFYFGGYGGGTWWHDAFATHSGVVGTVAEYEFDTGYNVGGFLGFRFCNGFRVEGEIGYRNSDLDRLYEHDGAATTQFDLSSGELSTISYMANFIYECAFIMCDCCMRPYFGVGFGAANVTLEAPDAGSGITVNDDETVFAYQLIVGLAYPINECVDVALEYRWFDTAEIQLAAGTDRFETREFMGSHNIMVSAKYVFGGLW